MLKLLGKKARSTDPIGQTSDRGDDLVRSPALARIVEESERTASEARDAAAKQQAVAERIQRMYAFD